jgi:2'-5' RNA ligase
VRCFIACFLSPDSAAALAAVRPRLSGCRPVPVENLHVTLHFLGSVAPERREEVLALTGILDGRVTEATVLEMAGFPRRRRARTVVARLSADPLLTDWHHALAATWPTEESNRSFDAHITLARSRRGVAVPDAPSLAGLELTLLPPAAYVSETMPEGARYTPLSDGPSAG